MNRTFIIFFLASTLSTNLIGMHIKPIKKGRNCSEFLTKSHIIVGKLTVNYASKFIQSFDDVISSKKEPVKLKQA